MNIAVCMIVLNDEDNIGRALHSIYWADRLIIVDGGSVDGTVDIIQNHCPIPYTLIRQEWDNHFSKQRQFANNEMANLENLSQNVFVDEGDWWWVRLDSDERFPREWEQITQLIPTFPKEVVCVRVRQVNLYPDVDTYSARHGGWETHPRLFKNILLPNGGSAWRWQGQVHEYPELMTTRGLHYPDGGEIIDVSLPVDHYGWLDPERRADRESLYLEMPGSNFQAGQITNRKHVVRKVPKCE